MIMKKRFKQTQEKGFTLIEFVVVIAIMAILSLVAIPSFASYRENASNAKDLQNARIAYNRFILEDREMTNEELHSLVGLSDSDTLTINEDGSVKVNKQTYPSLIGGSNDNEEIDNLIVEGYIPVATAEELNNVRSGAELTYGAGTKWEGKYTGGLDKKYIQVVDIDLSGIDNFEPIGMYYVSEFTGTFDGGDYVISNLTIDRGATSRVGLFGQAIGATFKNIGLVNVDVTGDHMVGGLVGYQSDSSVTDSYAKGEVTGANNTGGLVGYQYKSSVSNSYATGSVNGGYSSTGGLVGGQTGSSAVTDSYATGSVNGESQVGGLVGWQYTSSTVTNSYATGNVTGGSQVGGLVGFQNSSSVSNSYWDKDTTGQEASDGGTGKTTEEMKNKDTYTDWDFESIWTIENNQYPTLR